VGSSPTPGALLADSTISLKYQKRQNKNIQLEDVPSEITPIQRQIVKDELKEFILLICKNQKHYVQKMLDTLLEKDEENILIICDYITAEQNEINLKESTKEGKIKVLVDLLKFLNYKNLRIVNKNDILSFLNKYRKNEEIDPTHRWIGTWNNRHMILLKFFRWINDPYNPDLKNRKMPQCMSGVKRLTRKEISRYKPSDLWTIRECEVFLKHCPSKRDRAFLSMALDTSCRPHELLNLKIEDIQFRISTDGSKQYAETTINGKTGQRTVPLINSIPYIKEWLQDHPFGKNKNYWIFISQGKTSVGKKLTRDGLLKHFQEYYRDKYYPELLLNDKIQDSDKAHIRSLLTKPFNLYILRHIALTDKSKILNEHMLRNHAGWSTTSKMPQVYIHHLGGASSKQLLQAFGMEKPYDVDIENKPFNKIINCPNCKEPNKIEN
jgi:integrase